MSSAFINSSAEKHRENKYYHMYTFASLHAYIVQTLRLHFTEAKYEYAWTWKQ